MLSLFTRPGEARRGGEERVDEKMGNHQPSGAPNIDRTFPEHGRRAAENCGNRRTDERGFRGQMLLMILMGFQFSLNDGYKQGND